MMCPSGFYLSVIFGGVWILCLSLELSHGAPTGVKNGDNVGSPLEDELFSLPKISDKTPETKTENENKEVPASNTLSQTVTKGSNQGNGASSPTEPHKGKQSNLRISGYEEVFETPAIDLTPRAVAEYLILTGDFGGFDMALYDLIRARVLNPYEVQKYKDAVGLEYERMLQQMLEAETSYLQEFNSLYDEKAAESSKVSGQMPVISVNKPVEPTSLEGNTKADLPKIQSASKLEVVKVSQQPIEETVAEEERKKQSDMELQKLLDWLDNEMRQEIVGDEEQVNQDELTKPEMVQQEVASQQEVGPNSEEKEVTQETSDETEQLENRDNNGKMMTEIEPETKSDA